MNDRIIMLCASFYKRNFSRAGILVFFYVFFFIYFLSPWAFVNLVLRVIIILGKTELLWSKHRCNFGQNRTSLEQA